MITILKLKPKAKKIKMYIQKNEPTVYKIYRIFTMNTRLSLKILSPLQYFIIQSEPDVLFMYIYLSSHRLTLIHVKVIPPVAIC